MADIDLFEDKYWEKRPPINAPAQQARPDMFSDEAWKPAAPVVMDKQQRPDMFSDEAWAKPVLPTPKEEEGAFEFWSEEAGRIAGTGLTEFLNSFGSLSSDLGITTNPLYHIDPIVEAPKSEYGDVAASLIQFVVPFTGALKGLSLGAKGVNWASKLARGNELLTGTSKLAKVSKGLAAGAITDFVAFEANDPFLAGAIQDVPALQNPLTEFLAADADDPAAVNRLRHAVEGLGLGLIFPQIIKGLKTVTVGSGKVGAELTKKAYKSAPNSITDWVDTRAKKAQQKTERIIQKLAEPNISARHIDELYDKAGMTVTDDKLTAMEFLRHTNAKGELTDRSLRKAIFKYDYDVEKGGEYLRELHEGLVPILNRVSGVGKTLGRDGEATLKDFNDFLKYKQAEQNRKFNLKKASKEKKDTITGGIPNKEVSEFLEKWEIRKLGKDSEYIHALESFAFKEMKNLNKALLDFAKSANLVNDDTIASFLQKGPLYVPFFRAQASDDFITVAAKKKLDTLHTPMKSLTEENLDVLGPVDNVLLNLARAHESTFKAGITNMGKLRYYEKLRDLTSHTNTKEYKKHASSIMPNHKDLTDLYGQEISRGARHSWRKKGYHIDQFYENGELKFWAYKDQFLKEQMEALGPTAVWSGVIPLLKVGGAFKRAVSDLITLDPTFAAYANFLRDTVSVALLSKSGFMPGLSSVRGLGATTKGGAKEIAQLVKGPKVGTQKWGRLKQQELGSDGWFEELKKAGGGFGHTAFTPEATRVGASYGKNLAPERQLKKLGVKDITYKTPGEAGKDLVRAAESVASRFEYASRTEEFRRLVSQGMSPLKAGVQVRDIGIDFGNRGTSTVFRTVSAMVPFLNAHMQGVSRTARALGAKKVLGKSFTAEERAEVKRVYARTAFMASFSGAITLLHLNADNIDVLGEEAFEGVQQTFKSIPQHVKNKNWIFVLPRNEQGENVPITIPSPFDFALLPNMVNKAIEDMFTDREKSFLWEYTKHSMLNIGRVGDLSLVPQVLRGPTEAAINRKFSGLPVDRPSDSRSAEDHAEPWTNGIAVSLGQTFGWSPMKVEHVLKSYFGTLGALAFDTADNMFWRGYKGLGDVPRKNSFLTRRMFQSTPLRSTQEQIDTYNRWEEVSGKQAAFNNYAKMFNDFDRKKVEEMLADPNMQLLLDLYPHFQSRLKQIANITSDSKRVMRDPHMPDQDKLDMLAGMAEAKNELFRDLDELYMSRRREFIDE
jgi:hypothetical protein